ncbi:MAG: hypothetical protein ACYDCC_07195 [Actinomycetota bacterium]
MTPQKKRAAKKRVAKKAVAKNRVAHSCSLCGARGEAAEGSLPSGWSFSTEGRDGRLEYLCSDCVRRNIRAIEGKLPQEWWE